MTSEERVLAIENDQADAALDDVRVELDAAVVEEATSLPMVQTIAEPLGDFRLARDGAVMLEPGPERHDKRFALLLAHAASSSALAPLIVFSIA